MIRPQAPIRKGEVSASSARGQRERGAALI
jgi:hypothetical protein